MGKPYISIQTVYHSPRALITSTYLSSKIFYLFSFVLCFNFVSFFYTCSQGWKGKRHLPLFASSFQNSKNQRCGLLYASIRTVLLQFTTFSKRKFCKINEFSPSTVFFSRQFFSRITNCSRNHMKYVENLVPRHVLKVDELRI